MSEASQISRYRPAVIAITGVAAAYGIYTLYSIYSDHPAKGGLHRSNAVHRGRTRRPSLPPVDNTRPDEEYPLGSVIIQHFPLDISWDISVQGQMVASELMPELGLPNDMESAFQDRLNMASIRCILRACALARTPAEQTRLDGLGLDGLRTAIAAGDVPSFSQRRADILSLLPEVTVQQIDRAIEEFTHSQVFTSSEDFDEITFAETEDADDEEVEDMEPSQGLKGLLYHIAEGEAKRRAYEHRGIHCEGCSERPIRGVRWHCLNCPDFDLCSTCEADNTHTKTHVFAKIKIPLPVLSQPTKECPLWYPGDPRKHHPLLMPDVKKRLQESYGFEAPQIDAHYDQFTCIANVPWPSDPNGIEAAIDRRAFNKALTSERWPSRMKSNLLYDRMFDFYDTNEDDLIGFEEFTSGLAYLRGHKRYTPLSRALQGFDLDGDGCVDRKDFIRLFRHKHEIQKLIIEDMVKCTETDDTRRAMDTLRSTQPISSVFSIADLPEGQQRTPQGKYALNGDMQPYIEMKTILDDDEGWPGAGRSLQRRPHERLQQHLSRFEELLDTTELDRVGAASIFGSSSHPISRQLREESMNGARQSQNVKHMQDRTPKLDGSEADDGEEAMIHDVLWQVIEEGFNEMLDPLFKKKEDYDKQVEDTSDERQRWRREIRKIAKQERKARKNSKAQPSNSGQDAEVTDPLIAMAISSSIPGSTSGPFVPTDTASLTRREQEIEHKDLDNLLSVAGYHKMDDEELAHYVKLDDSESDIVSDDWSDAGPCVEESRSSDPTMPQNMPNSSASLKNEDNEPETPPPRHRLEWLAELDKGARHVKERGGPGRLSFEEIEALVVADPTRQLRGLVISWLEWASF